MGAPTCLVLSLPTVCSLNTSCDLLNSCLTQLNPSGAHTLCTLPPSMHRSAATSCEALLATDSHQLLPAL